jgi:hypothetical protein
MSKKFFVAALALFALTLVNALRANAQSCPVQMFGVREDLAVNRTMQSQIEVTYFTSNDPNAFLSEKAGLSKSASYLRLNTNQFVAQLGALERDGVASVKKRLSATSFLGELAEMNLERNPANRQAGMINASLSSSNDLSSLDRQTEVSVLDGPSKDSDYYRVSLLSWFVDAQAKSGQRTVDYDGIVLMKPGQTAVFKLGSDFEVKRSGKARSYVAITMRSVNNVGLASLDRRAK